MDQKKSFAKLRKNKKTCHQSLMFSQNYTLGSFKDRNQEIRN